MEYKYDAIVILGRGIKSDGSLPPDPIARIQKGVELFKAGFASRIIMSGCWSYQLDSNPPFRTEAAALKEYAIKLGVPNEVIIEENQSKDTLGNAYFTKVNFCKPNNWRKIVVISSTDHLERSQYIFKKVFGTDYLIDFVVSEKVITNDEHVKWMLHVQKSLKLIRLWLEPIPDGDDVALFNLMKSKHPGYSTNPELSKDDLINMINQQIP